MPREVILPTAGAARAFGKELAALLRAGDVLLLSGALGSGKTTVTQGIGAGLGVRGPITSPTFVIARIHPSLVGGPALVHVDAFRLGAATEVDDLDLDASLEDSVTVIEWGRGLAEQLSPQRLELTIRPTSGDRAERHVTMVGVGERWTGPVGTHDIDGLTAGPPIT